MEPLSFSHGVVLSVDGASMKGPTEKHEFRFVIHNFRDLNDKRGFQSSVFRLKGAGIKSTKWIVKGTRIDLLHKWNFELKQLPTEVRYHYTKCRFFLLTVSEMLQRLDGNAGGYLYDDQITSDALPEGTLTIQCNLTLINQVQDKTDENMDETDKEKGETDEEQNETDEDMDEIAEDRDELEDEQNDDLLQLVSDFHDLYKSQKKCDVTIRCGARELAAHSQVLSARSTVLAELMDGENFDGYVEIQNFTPEEVEAMLRYLYSGELELANFASCVRLYNLAYLYHLRKLQRRCSNFIASKLRMDNICEAAICAYYHLDKALLSKVKNAFAVYDYHKITMTKAWIDLASKHPYLAQELMKPEQQSV